MYIRLEHSAIGVTGVMAELNMDLGAYSAKVRGLIVKGPHDCL